MTTAKITEALNETSRAICNEVAAALQFGAEVAIKVKEDYGLTIDTYRGTVWAVLFDEFEARVDVSHAAFVLANHIQKRC